MSKGCDDSVQADGKPQLRPSCWGFLTLFTASFGRMWWRLL